MCASTTSTAETSPLAILAANSDADSSVSASAVVVISEGKVPVVFIIVLLANSPSYLSHRRDNAELLHEAQSVVDTPLLRNLAIGEAENPHPRYHYRLAGRGNARQVPLVGAAHRPAGHNLVPFGHHILNF